MNAQVLFDDGVVLTQKQIDAYIDYQMALLEVLIAKRRRCTVMPAPRLRDIRCSGRTV